MERGEETKQKWSGWIGANALKIERGVGEGKAA